MIAELTGNESLEELEDLSHKHASLLQDITEDSGQTTQMMIGEMNQRFKMHNLACRNLELQVRMDSIEERLLRSEAKQRADEQKACMYQDRIRRMDRRLESIERVASGSHCSGQLFGCVVIAVAMVIFASFVPLLRG